MRPLHILCCSQFLFIRASQSATPRHLQPAPPQPQAQAQQYYQQVPQYNQPPPPPPPPPYIPPPHQQEYLQQQQQQQQQYEHHQAQVPQQQHHQAQVHQQQHHQPQVHQQQHPPYQQQQQHQPPQHQDPYQYQQYQYVPQQQQQQQQQPQQVHYQQAQRPPPPPPPPAQGVPPSVNEAPPQQIPAVHHPQQVPQQAPLNQGGPAAAAAPVIPNQPVPQGALQQNVPSGGGGIAGGSRGPAVPVQAAAVNPKLVNVQQQAKLKYPGAQAEYELSDEEIRKLQRIQDENHMKMGINNTENLAVQWEKVMHDFMPDMIVTFKLERNDDEYFHQDVQKVNTLIRGGFFESSDNQGLSINFKIVSPSGKYVYASRKGEGLFRFTANELGTYTFGFNSIGGSSKFITFVVGVGQANSLTGDEVQTLEGNVQKLYRVIAQMESQSNYLWVRQKGQLEGVNKTAVQTYYALLLELLCTAVATVIQVRVVKRMLSRRRTF